MRQLRNVMIGLVLAACGTAAAPEPPPSPDRLAVVLEKDALFWRAYNACDVDAMAVYFTEDLEFYHDKHGLTAGRSNLLDSMRRGLCGPGRSSLRRELVEGSLKVYPLAHYGAILSGEHSFYINEPGRPERHDGAARFTHVWRHEEGVWRMSRVLSYDHRPAPPAVARTPLAVPEGALEEYAGQYKAAAGPVVIALRDGALHLTAGPLRAVLHAASDRTFHVQDRDLQFEFTRDERGRVTGFTVRENGQIADEAVRQEP